jgi:hypothetical protein
MWELPYLLVWKDGTDRERKWSAFLADREFDTEWAATQINGPLVARVTNQLWRPTSYSNMK